MYGETGSELHAFGTDRFVVSWAVSKAGRSVPSAVAGWRATQVVNGGAPTRVVELAGDGARASGAHSVRIEVPADVESMPVLEARAWREATRPSFVRLLGDGYRVKGFVSDAEEGCFYVLTRDAAATAT
jgi:predicted GNAT superfamily acetyltransferase